MTQKIIIKRTKQQNNTTIDKDNNSNVGIYNQNQHKSISRTETSIPSEILQEMINKTLEAQKLAYCPYSHFQVGCCLLVKNTSANDYEYILGCNVENASFPASTCAERTAICKAVSMGHKKFEAICIVGGISTKTTTTTTTTTTPTDDSKYTPPCGVCRQVIREFAHPEFPIYMLHQDGCTTLMKTLQELLPFSFGPQHL